MFVKECARMRYVVRTFCSSVLLFLCLNVDIIATETGPYHGKVVACYWATWSAYRPDGGKFQLHNFNPTLCTHLMLAFALLDETEDSVKLIGYWDDLRVDGNGLNNITKLKNRYPHLKVMISVGGWQDGSVKYSRMAGDANRRSNFVKNTINFIRQHNFDGLDLVWEFPTKRGGSTHDKVNFLQLIKDLREEYDKYDLLLTAALGASKDTIDNAYNVKELSKYLDFMSMMCYDYHGSWGRVIGPNAPLHSRDFLNVEYTVNHMLKLGADPERLNLGVPFYGRTFLALDGNRNSSEPFVLGGKFKNYTFKGSYTQEEGFIGYNEICLESFDRNTNWSVLWDPESLTPYAVNDEKVIVYDNDRSIGEKVRYAMNISLGGIMIWTVDTDDFRGDCYEVVEGHRDYPLLRTIDREINEYVKHEKYRNNSLTASLRSNSVSSFKTNYRLPLVLFLIKYIFK